MELMDVVYLGNLKTLRNLKFYFYILLKYGIFILDIRR